MIEVSGLKKTINKVDIINDLSFKVDDGEVVGIFGVKETGKTLLLKILLGIVKPDEGKILIEDKELTRNSFKDIAYVSSERGIFYDMTPEEHMQYLRYYYPRFSEDIFKQYMLYFKVPLNATMDKLDINQIGRAHV